ITQQHKISRISPFSGIEIMGKPSFVSSPSFVCGNSNMLAKNGDENDKNALAAKKSVLSEDRRTTSAFERSSKIGAIGLAATTSDSCDDLVIDMIVGKNLPCAAW